MNMIIGKRQIIIVCLVLALGLAIYLNWFLASGKIDLGGGDADVGKNYGDTQFTGTDNTTAEAYFASARIEKEKSRELAIDTLENIVAASTLSAEDTAEIKASATAIADNIQAESRIENLLKAKGFSECLVYITDTNASVIVKTPGLLSTEQAQITDVMLTETDISIENIRIVEAK